MLASPTQFESSGRLSGLWGGGWSGRLGAAAAAVGIGLWTLLPGVDTSDWETWGRVVDSQLMAANPTASRRETSRPGLSTDLLTPSDSGKPTSARSKRTKHLKAHGEDARAKREAAREAAKAKRAAAHERYAAAMQARKQAAEERKEAAKAKREASRERQAQATQSRREAAEERKQAAQAKREARRERYAAAMQARREAAEERRQAAKERREVDASAHEEAVAASESKPFGSSGGGAPRTGTLLRINSLPWAQVFVDGRDVGNTPQRGISVTPGEHEVRLVNAAFDMHKTFRVRVARGQQVTRGVMLEE